MADARDLRDVSSIAEVCQDHRDEATTDLDGGRFCVGRDGLRAFVQVKNSFLQTKFHCTQSADVVSHPLFHHDVATGRRSALLVGQG